MLCRYRYERSGIRGKPWSLPVIRSLKRVPMEKKITVGNSHICSISTMHAEISDKERMFRGDSTAAHNGCNNRNLSFFYNGGKISFALAQSNHAAGEEQRLFCLLKHLQSFFELSHMYAGIWFITTDIDVL